MAVQMLLYWHCKSSLSCGHALKQGSPSLALSYAQPSSNHPVLDVQLAVKDK